MQKILVVEDDIDIQDILKNHLSDAGYEVVIADDGVDGIAKFDETISLVLLDIMLPKIDGYGVCDRALLSAACLGAEGLFCQLLSHPCSEFLSESAPPAAHHKAGPLCLYPPMDSDLRHRFRLALRQGPGTGPFLCRLCPAVFQQPVSDGGAERRGPAVAP